MDKQELLELTVNELCKMLPKEYYVCQKRLWCGDSHIDINHIDDDLDKDLNYKEAIIKMILELAEDK